MINPANSRETVEPIAIIGIGCRFPGGVNSPESFWDLLTNQVDAIGEIPSSRMDIERLFDPRPATPGRIMTRWGGFLENIDQFDASFFGMSPREADRLDPQQRLVLEVAWEAMEDAGEPLGTDKVLNGGVFVGAWLNDYEGRLFLDPDQIDFYMTTGSGRYSIPGRLSYFLGMQGPSINIDTACSSSLVAVHLACQSLRNGECALALAGGSNVILQPNISIAYSQSRMMAPDGRCKFGDARGNGYVRSEGAAIIALKRLSDALADKNPIYALIRGSAVNNDGRSSGFLTTPGGAGQEDMLRKAYQNAGISPSQVQYVEAHGTGTRAGDPVEIVALGAVLRQDRPAGQFCRVGSVKTNLGHTEGAAGAAGLIKVALSLKNRYLPASLHFQEANPAIPWDDLPVRIQAAGEAWPEHEGPAIAGVSAFGIAGTNAHIVLQEAPAHETVTPAAAPAGEQAYLFPLSARSPSALRDTVQQVRTFTAEHPDLALYDLAYTSCFRRPHHDHRVTFTAASRQELLEQFDSYLESWQADQVAQVETARRKVLFIFPGQGSQWLGMGLQLMRKEAVFRAALERCSRAIEPLTGWSLIAVLQSAEIKERIEQIDFIQPALFAMQVALAEQWRAWGVEPDAVAGHSMGEIAAACIAGAISLEDAARVICRRSQLMKTVSGMGAMISVDLSLEDARAAITGIEDKISIAVSNSPRSTVLSGDPAAIEEVANALKERNVLTRQVKVDVAAHSPQMEPLRPRLEQALAGLEARPAAIPIYSTVNARLEEGTRFDIAYWGRNLRQPVLFSTILKEVLEQGFDTIIEISPHPVLLAAVEQGSKIFKPDAVNLATLPSAKRNEGEQVILLQSFGKLYALGHPVDWSRIYPREGKFVKLPTYPWQRERFWLDIESPQGSVRSGKTPLSGYPVEIAAAPEAVVREIRIDKKQFPELFAHRLFETTLLPASAYIELIKSAVFERFGTDVFELREISFQRALPLLTEKPTLVQVSITPAAEDHYEVILSSRGAESWQTHVSGFIRLTPPTGGNDGALPPASTFSKNFTPGEFYNSLKARGILFDAPLRAFGSVSTMNGAARGELLPEARNRLLSLDPAFQLTAAGENDGVFIPSAITSIRFLCPQAEITSIIALTLPDSDPLHRRQEIFLLDGNGNIAAALIGVQPQNLGQAAGLRLEDSLYRLEWKPAEPASPAGSAERWLILSDRHGVGANLSERLGRQGHFVQLVMPAEVTADGSWLKNILAANPAPVAGIAYLGALDHPARPELEQLTRAHADRIAGIVRLLKQCSTDDQTKSARLWIVTRGAQPPAGALLEPDLAAAPLWGLGRVIAEEHSDAWGGLIDLDPQLSADKAAGYIAAEISAKTETQISYYADQRRVLRLARLETHPANTEKIYPRPDSSYLITGGMGGIGLEVARWLVKQGARRLILMGRTPLPDRSTWADLPADHPLARRVLAVRELERLGASIHLAAVDSADETQLRDWLTHYHKEGWPQIRGVIHAAGVTRDRLAVQTEAADWDAVQRPKVMAGWLLHKLLGDLDFFILFSSIGSTLGLPGQGSYAAANAFLDALAGYRQNLGLPATSINWGPWESVGMAAGSGGQVTTQALEKLGIAAIPTQFGLDVLGRLMGSSGPSQTVVLPVDWKRLHQGHITPTWRKFLADQAVLDSQPAETVQSGPRETLLAVEPGKRLRELETYLQQQIAQVLKLPPNRITPSKPFGSLGLDSLMAIELRSRLETVLDISLAATFVWSYPTLAQMAPYIAEKMNLFPAENSPAQTATQEISPVQAEEQPSGPAVIEFSLENTLAEINALTEDGAQETLFKKTPPKGNG